MADIITTVGLNATAEMLGGIGSVTSWTYLAVGSGGNTAVVGDTQLQTEITANGLARSASTMSTDSANVLQLLNLWTASDTQTIEECGISDINTSTAQVLLAHSDFDTITLASDDTFQVTYKVTVA